MANDKDQNEDQEQQNNTSDDSSGGKQSGDGQQSNKEASDSSTQQEPPPTWLSWGIRGFSLAVLIFMLGYFTYSAIRPETKPELTFKVQLDKVEQRGSGWALPVKVTNEGSMSAHSVEVTATLTEMEEQPEESVIVPLLGPNEAVSVTFWFGEDPRGKGPELSVGSYLLP